MKINNLLRGGDSYSAPSIEIVEFAVEAGFAQSDYLNAASDGSYVENANGDY